MSSSLTHLAAPLARCLALLAIALLVPIGTARAGVPEGTPVEGVVRDLVDAMNERDPEAIDAIIDARALGARAYEALGAGSTSRRAFIDGIARQSLGERIVRDLAADPGAVKLMRWVERDGETRPLVRLRAVNGAFDYHEYFLEPRAEGGYRVVDWYQLSRGEPFSMVLAGLVRLTLDPDPGALERWLGTDASDPTVTSAFRRLGALRAEGKATEALDLLDSLPPTIARSRPIMLLRVQFAAAIEGAADGPSTRYAQTLAELAEHHADESGVAFVLVDHYLLVGDLDRAAAALLAVERRVGRDGMTGGILASIYLDADRAADAVTVAREAIRAEDDFEEVYFTLAAAQTMLGEYAAVIDTYRQLEARFGYEFSRDVFEGDAEQVGFVASPEFEAWLPPTSETDTPE